MKKHLTSEKLITTNIEQEVFNKFLNKKLPFVWTSSWAYTQGDDSSQIMLTSTNVKFADDKSRLSKVAVKNAEGKDVYAFEEYFLADGSGDERFKHVDIGCFENFFAIIYLINDRINGEYFKNIGLKAFDYNGELIGHFEPEALAFEYYSKRGIDLLKATINKQLAQQANENVCE